MTKDRELMVWTWAGWEPLQFYRRLGGFHEQQEGNALWADDWMALLRSERCAKALAEAGVNWVTTHFYKGFGLDTEAEEIAHTAEMIRNFHRHGLRVFTYLQYGTVVPETLVAEEPDAARWGRMDWNGRHDGHPYEYGNQYWRAKPCANQPGFREYLLRCVEKAIGIGADGIWVDNLNADGCHCPRCQEAFRAFLAQTVKDPWRDLGLRDLGRVGIPRAERPRDPVWQRWVLFRCEETRESLRLIAGKARALKPDVVLAVNIGLGSPQRFTLDNGNWPPNLDAFDFTYAENDLFPRIERGRIVSQHFPMKLGEAAGFRVVPGGYFPLHHVGAWRHPTVPDARALRRAFAESALFGAHALGGPWGLRGEDGGADPLLLRDAAFRAQNREFAGFYREHWALFERSRDVAPVGLLYSLEAMSWDEASSRRAFEAMEQLLRRNQIPFRYVLSDRLDPLEGLSLLVLPHVLPVSDALAARLRAFVDGGGRLVATGRCSLYDEWMRQRRDYALADLFGASFSVGFEEANADRLVVNSRSGCVFAPGEWGLADPKEARFCRLPDARLLAAIRGALAAHPSLRSSSRAVGFETRRAANGSPVFGLLNYGPKPVRGLELSLPADATPARLRALAPGLDHVLVPRRGPRGRAQFRLPPLDVEMNLIPPA